MGTTGFRPEIGRFVGFRGNGMLISRTRTPIPSWFWQGVLRGPTGFDEDAQPCSTVRADSAMPRSLTNRKRLAARCRLPTTLYLLVIRLGLLQDQTRRPSERLGTAAYLNKQARLDFGAVQSKAGCDHQADLAPMRSASVFDKVNPLPCPQLQPARHDRDR